MKVRSAVPDDAEAIARIYNEGIDEGAATFQTRRRTPDEVRRWFDGRHPIVAVEDNGKMIAFAAALPYSDEEPCAGVAEAVVYVTRGGRRRRAGHLALKALIDECRKAGFWKLVGRILPENIASRGLVGALDFREVGVHRFHGKVDGEWKDMILVERLIRENL